MSPNRPAAGGPNDSGDASPEPGEIAEPQQSSIGMTEALLRNIDWSSKQPRAAAAKALEDIRRPEALKNAPLSQGEEFFISERRRKQMLVAPNQTASS